MLQCTDLTTSHWPESLLDPWGTAGPRAGSHTRSCQWKPWPGLDYSHSLFEWVACYRTRSTSLDPTVTPTPNTWVLWKAFGSRKQREARVCALKRSETMRAQRWQSSSSTKIHDGISQCMWGFYITPTYWEEFSVFTLTGWRYNGSEGPKPSYPTEPTEVLLWNINL